MLFRFAVPAGSACRAGGDSVQKSCNPVFPRTMGAMSLPALVLIVDDDPHIRDVVRFALEKEGFVTSEAGDGAGSLHGSNDLDFGQVTRNGLGRGIHEVLQSRALAFICDELDECRGL